MLLFIVNNKCSWYEQFMSIKFQRSFHLETIVDFFMKIREEQRHKLEHGFHLILSVYFCQSDNDQKCYFDFVNEAITSTLLKIRFLKPHNSWKTNTNINYLSSSFTSSPFQHFVETDLDIARRLPSHHLSYSSSSNFFRSLHTLPHHYLLGHPVFIFPLSSYCLTTSHLRICQNLSKPTYAFQPSVHYLG